MRAIRTALALLVAAALAGAPGAGASPSADLLFFWGEGCPHCEREKAFLERLAARLPGLRVRSYEVRRDPANARLFTDLSAAFGVRVLGVPTTFVGPGAPIAGFDRDETTGRLIEERVARCLEAGCPDPMERLAAPAPALAPGADPFAQPEVLCGEAQPDCVDEAGAPERVTLPLLGEVDGRTASLPAVTVAIAFLDGFNPCAFFVLLTLLGLLLHVRSRARLLLVGGIFVLFSGLVYFLFMAAWLNVFLVAGQVAAVTRAAGIVALAVAAINVKDFFLFKRGVSLSIPESAKPRLFARMRRLIAETSLLPVVAGTVVLAAAANLYELFCTAGFPMVYTRILTLHRLPKAGYYLYLALYNLVYVVPLAAIVLLFAITLGARKLSEEQGRALKLLSGTMMLGLGLALLLRPEALSSVAASAGLLAGSVAVTALAVLATRRRGAAP